MKMFFAKRPTLFVWATVVAMVLARVSHHGPRGFHNW